MIQTPPAERVGAYIGLGSNLDRPVEQLRRALQALDRLPESRLVARSRFYRSRPMGPSGQPDYVNAVAKLDTALAPLRLLNELQAVELGQGRRRDGQRWGARTLDLDLLLYGEQRIDLPRLQVPHPGLASREFVLFPLLEIAGPDLPIPDLGRLGELAARCPCNGLEPLS